MRRKVDVYANKPQFFSWPLREMYPLPQSHLPSAGRQDGGGHRVDVGAEAPGLIPATAMTSVSKPPAAIAAPAIADV